jgi:hypothetical protein
MNNQTPTLTIVDGDGNEHDGWIEADGYLWSNEETVRLWSYFYAGNELPETVTSWLKLRSWFWRLTVAPNIEDGDDVGFAYAQQTCDAIDFRQLWDRLRPTK